MSCALIGVGVLELRVERTQLRSARFDKRAMQTLSSGVPAPPNHQPWTQRRLVYSLVSLVVAIGLANTTLLWLMPINFYITAPLAIALVCACFMREPETSRVVRILANLGVGAAVLVIFLLAPAFMAMAL